MYQRLFAMLIAFALLAGLTATPTVSAQGMKLQKGDHISIIGNALADRMQHDGWLETYLQSAMPNFQLSIRNLAFSGDQVAHRPRAHKAFGDANSHLTHTKASVIFAFFGYNESFSNKPDDFKNALNKWIDESRRQI